MYPGETVHPTLDTAQWATSASSNSGLAAGQLGRWMSFLSR